MDRRNALKALIGSLSVTAFATAGGSPRGKITRYGASPPDRQLTAAIKASPRFHKTYAPLKGIAKEGRKNVFLYQNLQKEIGNFPPHYQGPAPDGAEGEGDCIGQSSARGCDVLAASDIHLLGQREKFVAECSVEMNYAGGRVEIGGLGGGALRGRGGSHGEWQAKYLKQFGVLHRLKYERDGNELDLTGYHPGRSRKYRDVGVPDWLEPIAREHPVEEITNVKTGMEALDAVASGQPVIIGSSYAIKGQRDAQGFALPYLGGSTRRGRWTFNDVRVQWWHAMVLVGAVLEGGRIGGTILNSHGKNWIEGPQPFDLPDGGFNIDLEYLDLMIKDWGDCWALGSYKGHAAKRIREHLLYIRR